MSDIATELSALRHRPGLRTLAAIWCAQIVVFAYTVAYLVDRYAPGIPAGRAEEMHRALLPAQLGAQALSAMPVYGGPVMLIIGALIGGGDYRWGTLRTILARRPVRAHFLYARLCAMAVVMLALAALTLVVGGVCGTVVALAGHDSMRWPGPVSLLAHLAGLWLICLAWSTVGFALAVLTRSLVVAVGIGLVWTLVLENVVAALSTAVPGFAPLRKGLLSAATGSLSAALDGVVGGTSGVTAVVTGPAAVCVLAAFIAVGVAVSVLAFVHQDIP